MGFSRLDGKIFTIPPQDGWHPSKNASDGVAKPQRTLDYLCLEVTSNSSVLCDYLGLTIAKQAYT
jgi:hypothetical protein